MTTGIVITTEGKQEDFVGPLELPRIYVALDVNSTEVVAVSEGISVHVDGEGVINNTALNKVGTLVFSALAFFEADIHGNILFTGGKDEAGNYKQLDPEQRGLVLSMAKQAWNIVAELEPDEEE